MIDVTFYEFSKSPKSTKIVNVEGVTYQCELIENTSIISPVIRLNTDFSTIRTKNYVYIPIFDRYYFITNVVYTLGLWDIHLEEDTLASNKTGIGASTQYVERASSDYNGNIIDTKYQTNTSLESKMFVEEDMHNLFGASTEEWFIVGIIGSLIGIDMDIRPYVYNGSVVYYCLKQTELQYFFNLLLESVNLYAVPTSEISLELQKQLINPIQYIHSIRVLPFKPTTIATAKYINLGFNHFPIPDADEREIYICRAYDVEALNISNGFVHEYRTYIFAEVHPDYETKGAWVQSQPYTKYVVVARPFGRFEIPSGIVNYAPIYTSGGKKYIKVALKTMFDCSTGSCTLQASVADFATQGSIFYENTLDLTVDVPYHQSTQDYIGFRQQQMDLANSGVNYVLDSIDDILDLDIGGALKRGANMVNATHAKIRSADMANQVSISGNSSNGSQYCFHKDWCTPMIIAYYERFVDEYNTDFGRPLCEPRQINSLSGYIQCKNANFSSSAYKEENDAIISFMNGGFFYE